MRVREAYESSLQSHGHQRDEAQVAIVALLDDLQTRLHARRPRHMLARLFGSADNDERIKGLYLWGGVGRGKTFLMDLFYECLPVAGKQRIHFHRFMQRVHNALAERPDTRNPLSKVAASWAESPGIACISRGSTS